MQVNGDSERSVKSVQNNKRETTRNTEIGQKESEQETHKLNIFLCSKEVIYVILRTYFERVMSFCVNFFMILVILRKFLRARIAYMENFLYLCTLIVKYSENDNVFCNIANRT